MVPILAIAGRHRLFSKEAFSTTGGNQAPGNLKRYKCAGYCQKIISNVPPLHNWGEPSCLLRNFNGKAKQKGRARRLNLVL
jgi:hypothetical protein